MKRITTILFIGFLCTLMPIISHAQAPVDYRDVGVIVNITDSNSVQIGRYFMKKRKIPAENLIRISTFSSEIIDSATFEKIRKQVEDTLKDVVHRKTALNKKLNYLVTTKGVPLKVNRTDTCNDQDVQIKGLNLIRCAAFDNELMLVLGKYKNHIGLGDFFYKSGKDTFLTQHPYFDTMVHFSRAAFDIFLVTRLSGFTESDVFKMIDSSGPNKLINKAKAQFVIDGLPYSHNDDTILSNGFFRSYLLLKNRGWKVNFDSSTTFLSKQNNVLGYLSWGYTDLASRPINGNYGNTYTNSSIGAMYYSFTARTFISSVPGSKATIASLVKSGLTGAEGFVWEPRSFAMPEAPILFGMYTDTTVDRRYNLAESFYSSSPCMSWMATVAGDPKASIITHIPAVPTPKIDTITHVNSSKPRTINTTNNLPGNYNWFATDSISLKALGLPYDSTNPKWAASGKSFKVPTNLSTGTHTYTYVNENISGIAFRQVTFGFFTALDEDLAHSVEYDIYPNPASGHFMLNYQPGKSQNISISVTDMLGREVYSKAFAGVSGLKEDINIAGRPSGIYFCHLIVNGMKSTKKVVME